MRRARWWIEKLRMLGHPRDYIQPLLIQIVRQIRPLFRISSIYFYAYRDIDVCQLSTDLHTLGLAWGCVAVSFLFLAFRIYVRLRVFRRLYDDDTLIVVTRFVLLTTAILWVVNRSLKLLYEACVVADGDSAQSDYHVHHLISWNHIILAESYLHL